MPDKRPRPRGSSYQTPAFFVGDWNFAPKRRAEIIKRGIPETVIRAIEREVAVFDSYSQSKPPSPSELRAALAHLKRPAAALRAALSDTDAQTLAYLRRSCDVLQPDPAYVGSMDRDLESLLGAIDKVNSWIASWSKPRERSHVLAAIVRGGLEAAGLKFDSKPKGQATLLMRAILDDDNASVRYFLDKASGTEM